MPPRHSKQLPEWAGLIVAVATAIAGAFGLASLPAKLDALSCRLESIERRIDAVERHERLADELRRVEAGITTGADRIPR